MTREDKENKESSEDSELEEHIRIKISRQEDDDNVETVDIEIPSKGIFSAINSLLYLTDGPSGTNPKLCVPSALTKEVISLVHNAAHTGIRKTFQSIPNRYYIPQASKLIRDFINKCGPCQTSKPSHEKKPGKLQPVQSPPVPGHTISIDFVTGLPESKDGKNALLTITCKFSKAIILISCRDTTSVHDVACLYFERAYCTFGLPSKIISDREA